MAAALSRDIPIVEYSPKKIKQAVTGNGNASKEQVAQMLMHLLQFKVEETNMLDATDALAVAFCHFSQKGVGSQSKQKSWGNFIKDNPGRVK
jgi:crossover junction endodeoxyribonuclease RuvC